MLASGWTERFVSSVGGILLAAVVVCGDRGPSAQLQLSDLAGRQVEPFQSPGAKTIVFLFTRTDCPISNRYAPEVRRLYAKFAASGATFYLVYPDPDES